MSEPEHVRAVGDDEYRDLLEFRNELRRFLRWSEERAGAAGLTRALHQLMLVVRGHPGREGPTIADAALALDMRHHSAVELAQRAEAAGLIGRRRGEVDHRRVHLTLTEEGSRRLEALTRDHLPRIRLLARAPRRGFDEVC
jgi:DNA-binding MarR family transcriptional regulator